MSVTLEWSDYSIYGKCLHIYNDVAELYVSSEFGPRVLHYSLKGQPNTFYTNEGMNYIQKGPEFDNTFYPGAYWNVYGGNRLWKSPHFKQTNYYPDHDAVDVEVLNDGAIFRCKPQIFNNVQHTVEIHLAENSSEVSMRYEIKNVSDEQKKIACWALSVCDIGGVSIFPQPQTRLGVLPNRHISLWDYSDMRDERVYWGGKYVALLGDPNASSPIKIGINNVDGWACYLNKGFCFVLRYEHVEGGEYTDFGVSYESYANPYFLELESMSPTKELSYGESVTHAESWELFTYSKALDYKDESQVDLFVERYIKKG